MVHPVALPQSMDKQGSGVVSGKEKGTGYSFLSLVSDVRIALALRWNFPVPHQTPTLCRILLIPNNRNTIATSFLIQTCKQSNNDSPNSLVPYPEIHCYIKSLDYWNENI